MHTLFTNIFFSFPSKAKEYERNKKIAHKMLFYITYNTAVILKGNIQFLHKLVILRVLIFKQPFQNCPLIF